MAAPTALVALDVRQSTGVLGRLAAASQAAQQHGQRSRKAGVALSSWQAAIHGSGNVALLVGGEAGAAVPLTDTCKRCRTQRGAGGPPGCLVSAVQQQLPTQDGPRSLDDTTCTCYVLQHPAALLPADWPATLERSAAAASVDVLVWSASGGANSWALLQFSLCQ